MLRTTLPVAVLLLAGCSSTNASHSNPAPNGIPADAAADAQFDEKGCTLPPDPITPDRKCIRSLNARVVTEANTPLVDFIVTACGDGCTFGKTAADGHASLPVHRYMRKPAMMLHGHSKYATYYIVIDGDGDVDLGTVTAPTMPSEGLTIPTDGTSAELSLSDITLGISKGAQVEIDTLELSEPEEQKLRVLPIPVDKAPPFIDPNLKFAAIYAFVPFATKSDPGFKLTVANTAGLTAGAAVEFYIQGTDTDDLYGPFGRFNKIADGHVSGDGTKITTDDGQSIPELTWLGIRTKG